jgi:hypothetical protein
MRKTIIFLFTFALALTASAQTINDLSSASLTDSTSKALPVTSTAKRSYFGIALGASASTNGFGGNITAALNKRFALRLGYETVNMTFNNAFTLKQDDRSFQVSPVWKSGGMSAIFDWYILKGLYLSAGVMVSAMNPAVVINSADPIKIGDIEYAPDEIGEIKIAIKPEQKVAPYAALGFGRNISRDHRLTMNFEMGAYFTKAYVVDVNGTKFFEANNTNESIDNLNTTLKDVSFSGIYPVIKVGISYKFYGSTKKTVTEVNRSSKESLANRNR